MALAIRHWIRALERVIREREVNNGLKRSDSSQNDFFVIIKCNQDLLKSAGCTVCPKKLVIYTVCCDYENCINFLGHIAV